MKYYSDITKRLYETREQLLKAEILQKETLTIPRFRTK